MTKADALKLTHINVSFAKIKDCAIYTKLKNLQYIKRIKEYNPKLKVIISVGGWGADGFSQAASTDDNRKLFSKNIIEFMKKYYFDGIDLDWEYPCYGVGNIASSPEDKYNFTLLLEELRNQLNSEGLDKNIHYLLTIAVGADEYYTDGTEMQNAHKYLDFIQLMTYDLRGGFQALTGHHTNLFTPTGDLFRISCDSSVNTFFRAGVPKEKLILGAAFYSRMWSGVPNVNNGLHQLAQTTGGAGPDFTDIKKDYINKNGFTRFWDDEAKSPYLFNGNEFISYDDDESLKHKCDYIKENDLLGIMFWHYSADESGSLLNELVSSLT
ncbi:glycoside hydrolase family 18 protein [Clostridium gasigenes]|uniref:glycoside hydrolase family 18 protein n=1 Tax=Clostridium gasigenes TaxID=94869 RepID=UPI001C0E0A87|nr:glycoside hydrolase family 18 protein [Clostridium gasigenes]MBU3109691.1 glycoside hydrolase family 18 protein [Clostridium gasigenes]